MATYPKSDLLTRKRKRQRDVEALDFMQLQRGESPDILAKRASRRTALLGGQPEKPYQERYGEALETFAAPADYTDYLRGMAERTELAGQPQRTAETHAADIKTQLWPVKAGGMQEERAGRQLESTLAGEAITQRGEAGLQPITEATGRAGLLGTQQVPALAALTEDIANATAAANAAYAEGDTARGQFYEAQLADLQNQRMALASAQLPIAQPTAVESPPVPTAGMGEPTFGTPPAPIGGRAAMLTKQAERATQGAGALGTISGLEGLITAPEGVTATGEPIASTLDSLVEQNPEDENTPAILSNFYLSLQSALSQATPEEAAMIKNSLRSSPGYLRIRQWQDADRFFSEEQRPGMLEPHGASLLSRMTGAYGQLNKTADLAKQIVSLVEGNVLSQ